MDNSDPMVVLENVTKRFKKATVLDHVSVAFPRGQIHGIIGRNGSGKTVMLKLICGFLPADEGVVRVNGEPVYCQKPQLNTGAIIEEPGFIPGISGLKNLQMLASLKSDLTRDDLRKVMLRVGLDPENRKAVGKYSMGMRQRLGIAQAIMEKPSLLLLDEPMNGLDNQGVEDIRRLLIELREGGTTILLASHSREDIQILCDSVHELDRGRLC